MDIKQKETVEKIIGYWNRGQKEKARDYLKLSSLILPKSTQDYLTAKFYGKPDPKSIELLIYACECFGGGKIYHNGKLIYEKEWKNN